MSVWHESDDFWETCELFMFDEQRWEQALVDVEQIISLLEIKPTAHILDLCCGPGRHSLEFSRRGFYVTGVDRTKKYLEEAKNRAKSENLNIDFIQEDMRKFCRPKSFDVVLNLYTSFSYFEDPEEDKQVLKNVYSSLKNGGKFIIEMMGKEILARIFMERNWHEHNGVFMLEERKVANNWSWMKNRWIRIKNGEVREFKVEHRIYSATELISLLNEVGFTKVYIFGNLEGTPYDHKARRLVGLAHKPS
ncbi:MAG: class I SAM-dependent methyltransferase [Candidatus Hodarchaeota archaeon]